MNSFFAIQRAPAVEVRPGDFIRAGDPKKLRRVKEVQWIGIRRPQQHMGPHKRVLWVVFDESPFNLMICGARTCVTVTRKKEA